MAISQHADRVVSGIRLGSYPLSTLRAIRSTMPWDGIDHDHHRLALRRPRPTYFAPLGGGSGVPLSLETEERPEAYLIRVAGEIDLGNVALLRAAIEPAVQNGRGVIMDLSGVTYLDSTTLHAIVTFDRRLKSHDCRFVVIGPSFLFKLIQITGLQGT